MLTNFKLSIKNPKFIQSGFFFFLILLSYILRFNLFSIPLERDEGEYAYMGQLILEGIPPYKFAFNMKFPGTYFFYSILFGFFGETIKVIHIGLLFVNLLTGIVIFFLVKRFYDFVAACFVTVFFIIYTSSPNLLGFAFHATHLVLFFFMIGYLFFLKGLNDKNYYIIFLSGICFGLSILMKQQAVFLVASAFLYCLFIQFKERKKDAILTILILCFGIVFLLSLPICYLYFKGTLLDFWFWTFTYASKYVSINNLSEGYIFFTKSIFEISKNYEGLWILFFLGIFLLPFSKLEKEKKIHLSILLLCSFLTTVPGFYFRNHYYIPFIPFYLIFAYIPFDFISKKMDRKYFWIIIILVSMILFRNVILKNKNYYFTNSPEQNLRMIYSISPFPEAVKISEYIQANSAAMDTISIIGSEPEIFFYSKRKSATGYIYMYPLMEKQRFSLELQKKMFDEIDLKKPKFIVFINNELEYFRLNSTKENNRYFFERLSEIKANPMYKRVLIFEGFHKGNKFTIGENLNNYRSDSLFTIDVLKKSE
jgi:hypothetical protein